MVFYLKYRPQTIEQLDSESVRATLSSVLANQSPPHAFLFTGPKGLGKTSTARIVAKYVNCEKGIKVSQVSKVSKGESKKAFGTSDTSGTFVTSSTIPCNTCASCKSITNGANLDVLEIDGASNRGIDEIRDLREKIRLLPVSARKKVYIIDEVHMLTTEAFNALLKTLEEPPVHAMFVLCTTEAHKVPQTIVSRCFHIAFKKASIQDLVASFERIIKGEKLHATKDALEKIASFSGGSFRDGAKILEEIVFSASNKEITKDLVEKIYHVTTIDTDVLDLLACLKNKDTKKGLEIVNRLVEQGTDIQYFLEQVLFLLHRILLIKVGVLKENETLDIDLETIKALFAVLSKAHTEIKSAVLPQLPLELAIVEWGEVQELRIKNQESRIEEKSVIVRIGQPAETLQSKPPTTDSEFWYKLLDALKQENHMLAGVLRSCRLRKHTNDGIVIEALSPFHKERLEDKKAMDVLEKICENITGKQVNISVVLK